MKRRVIWIPWVVLLTGLLLPCMPAMAQTPPAAPETQAAQTPQAPQAVIPKTLRKMAEQQKPMAPPSATPVELRNPEVVEKPEVKEIDHEGAGKLIQVGDHLVCVMEGTPREMGFQHGRLLAKRIQGVIKSGYMNEALWTKGYTPEYVNTQSARMEKHFPPEYIEELNGLLDGLKAAGVTDVTYEEVRLGVTQAEILHFDPDTPPGCTNFACWGQWTTDGRLLHGRNLDWSIARGAQDGAVVLVWRPKDGKPFMMLGWAGGIGSVTGMSSQGLTIGEMTCISPDSTFDGLPLFLTMRRVLEKTANLDEAIKFMQESPRTSGWNFILGDGKAPDGRALEVDAKACEVFTPMDPKEGPATGHASLPDAVRRTNHPVGEAQIEKLISRYSAEIEKQTGLKLESVKQASILLRLQNTWQRYDWLGKQIQAHPKTIDVKEALQMLCNGPVENSDTLHSCVMDPKNQVVYLSIAGNNPPLTATSRAYTRIDLSPWFK